MSKMGMEVSLKAFKGISMGYDDYGGDAYSMMYAYIKHWTDTMVKIQPGCVS